MIETGGMAFDIALAMQGRARRIAQAEPEFQMGAVAGGDRKAFGRTFSDQQDLVIAVEPVWRDRRIESVGDTFDHAAVRSGKLGSATGAGQCRNCLIHNFGRCRDLAIDRFEEQACKAGGALSPIGIDLGFGVEMARIQIGRGDLQVECVSIRTGGGIDDMHRNRLHRRPAVSQFLLIDVKSRGIGVATEKVLEDGLDHVAARNTIENLLEFGLSGHPCRDPRKRCSGIDLLVPIAQAFRICRPSEKRDVYFLQVGHRSMPRFSKADRNLKAFINQMLTPCLVNVPENRFALAATKARDFPKADDVRSAQMSSRDKDFRMRVLHFFKTYWPDTFGGVERTIHAIAKGCRAYGVEADVLALSPKPAPEPFVFDGHRVIQVKQDLDIASTGFSRAAFRAFRDLSRQADVVHFHFPWPFMDLVDLVTPHRKPVVVTYHSDIVKQKLLLRLYGPLMHHFLRGADRIVATSPNYLSSSPVLPLYRDKVEVIPLGLDEADYPAPDPQRIAYWQDRFPDGFFLFVGVLRYYKGIHILFEAARSTGLPVVIIGGGGLESELKARAEAEGLSQVHLLGPLADADKSALLSLCRALVFPSHLRSEAFGLSLVEAAMTGKPMISCEIGTGTSFVNLDEETGLVIPPDDPENLARAMRRLWKSEEECSRFGRAARLRYEAMFMAEKMAKAYADLYRRLR